MTITIDHIEDDKLRLRHHVTAGQAEHDADAILDGFDEMLEAIPETHHPYGSPMKVYVSFERDRRGAFRPSARYSRRAMATANTHDQVPLAGYWSGRDLDLRQRAGAYPDDGEYQLDKVERARAVRSLLRRLDAEGLPSRDARPDARHLTRSVHAFLAKTPAPLVGVSLDDLAGEADPVNLPGLGAGQFPSWSRRMLTKIEDLMRDAEVANTLSELQLARSGSGAPD